MTTTTKRKAMQERIWKHGLQLLAIFPNATERDPVKLCKRLRRLEAQGNAIGLQMCNGPEMAECEADRRIDAVLDQVNALLRFTDGGPNVFLNLDPNGYSLKIDSEDMRRLGLSLHSDWGGYGIIAPDLTKAAIAKARGEAVSQ